MKIYKFIFILIFIETFSQNSKIKIIDDFNSPVSYLYMKLGEKYLYTNNDGILELNFQKNDTLFFVEEFIEPSYITTNNLKNNQINLFKISYKTELSDLVVTQLDYTKYKKEKKYKYGITRAKTKYTASAGIVIATRIDMDNKSESLLSSVKINMYNKNSKSSKFKLRFYKIDSLSKMPEKEIITKDTIFQLTKKDPKINLEPLKIMVPKSGLYIGLEWIPESSNIKKNEILKYKRDIKEPYIKVTQSSREDYKTYMIDLLFPKSSWQKEYNPFSFLPYNLLLKVKIKEK